MRGLTLMCTASMLLAAAPPEWTRPFPAHRIAGNVYYVGTEDLACYLITDSQAGHILINSGLAESNRHIREGVEKLGFRMRDIKVLLTNQAHFDHVAGFAELQKWTGAKIYATEADARLLETGGAADPSGFTQYAPVKVDRVLKDREAVTVGKTKLTVHLMPGHSPGSVGYEMTVNGKMLLIANMATVVMRLDNPKYPRIADDLRATFARQKSLKPEIWVAAHGSQFGLAAKHKSGNYEDASGYAKAVSEYQTRFEELARKAAYDKGRTR
ncbi:MAG: subclass B3 metallo-beta-lactamase [Bryobacteraceae bacterium]|nr:subclass B3 metallo-beta-lactamase [Bryobacteraceae bacterium]